MHTALCRSCQRPVLAVLILSGCAGGSPPQLDTLNLRPAEGFESKVYAGLSAGSSQFKPNVDGTVYSVENGSDAATEVRLGVDLHDRLSLELNSAILGTATFDRASASTKYSSVSVNAIVYPHTDAIRRAYRSGLNPYGRIGFGVVQHASNVVPFDGSEQSLIAGGGFEYGFDNGFALRGEAVRYGSDAWLFGVGAVFRMGETSATGRAIARRAQEAMGQLATSDGTENVQTPIGGSRTHRRDDLMAAVWDREPTAEDVDGDGVRNQQDQCADSPRGLVVGRNGCGLMDGIVDGVQFTPGSFWLTPAARESLRDTADKLLAFPEVRVQVRGHTDNEGDAETNRRLSEARARAVSEYLNTLGVSMDQLAIDGVGEDEPLASNDSEQGRAQNRRIELLTLPKYGSAPVVIASARPQTPEEGGAALERPQPISIGELESSPASKPNMASDTPTPSKLDATLATGRNNLDLLEHIVVRDGPDAEREVDDTEVVTQDAVAVAKTSSEPLLRFELPSVETPSVELSERDAIASQGRIQRGAAEIELDDVEVAAPLVEVEVVAVEPAAGDESPSDDVRVGDASAAEPTTAPEQTLAEAYREARAGVPQTAAAHGVEEPSEMARELMEDGWIIEGVSADDRVETATLAQADAQLDDRNEDTVTEQDQSMAPIPEPVRPSILDGLSDWQPESADEAVSATAPKNEDQYDRMVAEAMQQESNGDVVDAAADALSQSQSAAATVALPPSIPAAVHVETLGIGGPLRDVRFGQGSHRLTAASRNALSLLAIQLKANPEVRISIITHVDDQGSEAASQTLSEKQGDAIIRQLEHEGIARERLELEAYGASLPVAQNVTLADRIRNRRIEVRVLD